MSDIRKALKGSTSLGGVAGAFADAEEQGDKNEQISDSAKLDALADMIRDACTRMDEGTRRQDTRMDALEENFRRMDSERKDAEKKDEEKGEPEETAADRKDASAEEREEGGKVADRKDADEKEEKREDADEKEEKKEEAAADSVVLSRSELNALKSEIAALNARAPAIISDADRERYAMIQENADPAFQAFGDRAPAPLDGETPTQYKRRLGTKLQKHSPKWKDTRLSGISDEAVLDNVVDDIYADSINAARAGVDVPLGQLRAIERQAGGHTFIEYEGQPDSWMNRFAGHSQRATGNWLRPH